MICNKKDLENLTFGKLYDIYDVNTNYSNPEGGFYYTILNDKGFFVKLNLVKDFVTEDEFKKLTIKIRFL